MAKSEAGTELLVPAVSDAILKYTWHIRKYAKCAKKDSHDSPAFDFNVNGMRTRWNLSVRYWRGPSGRRLANPAVLCLNLLASRVRAAEQVRVRFQFAVRDARLGRWETCPLSRVALQLQDSSEMLSVGYRDLSILERHLARPSGDLQVSVKLQVVPTDCQPCSLAQDMGGLLEAGEGSDVWLVSEDGRQFPAHASVLAARSPVLAALVREGGGRPRLPGVPGDLLQEVLRYVYTDRAEHLDALAGQLLAVADRLRLPGLKALCERALVETLALGRAALEAVVDPEGLGSSASSGLDSIASDTDLLPL
ncbi:speckle-type POZ protein-like [Bacillus rossius redtenbacheri]|uniref:speckle-type POZ protein-like n=1 Tax=Bacillus rossius redtenbacheri TaxID=93214 RepID=UPI002FDE3AFC